MCFLSRCFGVILCLFVCLYPVSFVFLDHSLSADVESVSEREKHKIKRKSFLHCSIIFAITVMRGNVLVSIHHD